MEDQVAQSSRRNKVRRAKAANRPSRLREPLLDTGARLFVERGMTNVSVEELIAGADVSRATFYGFFANKQELAAAILFPVFASGIAAMEKLYDLAPREAAAGLIDIYLQLWNEHRNALLLVGAIDGTVFPYVRSEHAAYGTALRNVLRVIESGNLLKNDSVELTIEVLARTGIPLLRIYRNRDDLETIYRDSMLGLILKH